MIHSFRLRLALLSVLLTGIILVSFGIGTLWLIRDIKFERIDNDIRAYAERECSRDRSIAEWQRLESEFATGFGIRNSSYLIILIQDRYGDTIYRSSHWPASLDSNRFPWPESSASKPTGKAETTLIPEAFSEQRASETRKIGHPASNPNETSFTAPPPDEPPPRPDAVPDNSRPQVPPHPGPPPDSPPSSAVILRTAAGHHWHIGLAHSDRSRVAIAVDTLAIEADMSSIRNAFVITLPFALVLIGLGGWIFSSKAMRPLSKLIATANRVITEGLNQQIDTHGEDREFVELIDVFNHMLVKIRKNQSELKRMALQDTLTGLPNRRLLIDHMHQALSRAKRNTNNVAAIFLDLDGFKQINDTLGHKAGDEALKEIARRLLLIVRKTDTLSRLGGDEFVLLMSDIEESAADSVQALAEKCINSISKPLCLSGSNCSLGVSIGIAVRNGDCSPDQLLSAADKAMYEAKQKGRGQYVFAS